MPDTLTIQVCGEALQLLPERGIFWERRETLFIADPHFGNTERLHAPPDMPAEGNTAVDLARLDQILKRTHAQHLVILGDLIHARGGQTPRTLALLQAWRESHPALHILLVRGNHDHVTGDPPTELGIQCVDEPYSYGPFALRHYPVPNSSDVTLAGHLHPMVRYTDRETAWEPLSVFVRRDKVLILPAFGSFLRQPALIPLRNETVYIINKARVSLYAST